MTTCMNSAVCLGLICVFIALLPVTSSQACGGCEGDPNTQSICPINGNQDNTQLFHVITKQESVLQPYRCYYWIFRYYRVIGTCYRTTYRQVTLKVLNDDVAPPTTSNATQACCSGYTRTDDVTCTKCGRSKYSVPVAPVGTGLAKAIIGGSVAQPNQFPWIVRLLTQFTGHYSNCGGTIVGKRWIITAAHCVHGGLLSYSRAIVGDHDRRSTSLGVQETHYRYSKIYTHPSFIASGVSNYDIALVQTDRDILFNGDVQPACLPTKEQSYIGQTVTMAGWGRTDGSSTTVPDFLQYMTATVIPDYLCNSHIFNRIICARGYLNNVCSGDSGGPMVLRSAGYDTLIGISWWSVRGCPKGLQFGVTDVAPYLAWINLIMFQ